MLSSAITLQIQSRKWNDPILSPAWVCNTSRIPQASPWNYHLQDKAPLGEFWTWILLACVDSLAAEVCYLHQVQKQQSYTEACTEAYKTHVQSSQGVAGLQSFIHSYWAAWSWMAALGYPHQPVSAFTPCTSSAHITSPGHPSRESHAFSMQISRNKNLTAQ